MPYPGAIGVAVSCTGKYLLNNYVITVENESASAICVVDLDAEESWWFETPFSTRHVWPVYGKIWGIFVGSYRDRKSKGYFLELDSMRHTGPGIPVGLPIVREGISVCGIAIYYNSETQQIDDLWLLDLASGTQRTLPASEHKLRDIRAQIWSNRIVISGRPAEEDKSHRGVTTQLWSFPELKKISEYRGTEYFPWQSRWHAVALGDDSFCFALAPGLRKVADLKTGKVRFSLGHVIPQNVWIDFEHAPIHVMEASGYVQDTGSIVCLEQFANAKQREIKIYDVKTGDQLREVSVSSRNLKETMIAKLDGEWILLCGYIDPKEHKDVPSEVQVSLSTMWFMPYRLKDLAKGKNSIETMWDGLLRPMVANGQMIAAFEVQANILDLSRVVEF
ncbi:MAG: hypothetical protein ISS79_06425 [Phycisphaerae bacterium]|nr:hypothetical protein [Phycisphaerae bacterium]